MRNYRSALLISSDTSHRESVALAAYRCGLHLLFSARISDARALLARKRFALIFCSDQLSDSALHASLQSLRDAAPEVPVIVLSHVAEWSACIDAMRDGAFDYVAWPADPAETERVVRLALAQRVSQLHSAA